MCIETLRNDNIELAGYWYNPNIHPFTEYKSRKNTLIEYSKKINLELIVKDNYGLREFITNIYPDYDNRCSYCYRSRLEETAKTAVEKGFDSFSTSLLISPYQKQWLIVVWLRKQIIM
jgi:predicted adenine nucleotide alpha hydrolase (AANH) superfamily ATPase